MDENDWIIWAKNKDKNDLDTAIAGILALIYFLLFMAVVLGYIKIRDLKQEQQTEQIGKDI